MIGFYQTSGTLLCAPMVPRATRIFPTGRRTTRKINEGEQKGEGEIPQFPVLRKCQKIKRNSLV
jgi:hypothetical protein